MKDYAAKEALTKDKPMLKIVEFINLQDRDDIFFRLIMTEHTDPNCCFDNHGYRSNNYSTRVISSQTTWKCLEYSHDDGKALYDDLKEYRDRSFDFKEKELSGGHYFKSLQRIIDRMSKIVKENEQGRLCLSEPFEIFDAKVTISKEKNGLNSFNNKVAELESLIAENEKKISILKEMDRKPIHKELWELEEESEEFKKLLEKSSVDLFDEYWANNKKEYIDFFTKLYTKSRQKIIKKYEMSLNKMRGRIRDTENLIKDNQEIVDTYKPEPYETETTGILRKILLKELQAYSTMKRAT